MQVNDSENNLKYISKSKDKILTVQESDLTDLSLLLHTTFLEELLLCLKSTLEDGILKPEILPWPLVLLAGLVVRVWLIKPG